ncbi:MAG: Mini-ribonuclease 3 [Bacillota bacterium]
MFDFLPLAQPAGLSPALLAYVGDAVFEVYVRSVLAAKWAGNMDEIHHQAVLSVKAEAQARMLKYIENTLTDEERDIVRRGRNSKAGHIPKNAAMMDYRYSTAFESLIGFLYLGGQVERLSEILGKLEGHILNGGEDTNESGLDKLDT